MQSQQEVPDFQACFDNSMSDSTQIADRGRIILAKPSKLKAPRPAVVLDVNSNGSLNLAFLGNKSFLKKNVPKSTIEAFSMKRAKYYKKQLTIHHEIWNFNSAVAIAKYQLKIHGSAHETRADHYSKLFPRYVKN